MNKRHCMTFILGCFTVLLHSQLPAPGDFPAFPPENVTSRMDRNRMLNQLGIKLPVLPARSEDPNRPAGAKPADLSNPEGNWISERKFTITRSEFGLWNNYSDRSSGFFPGSDSARLGDYEPIDLFRMHDGRTIMTADEWWNLRRPEIMNDILEHLYGKIPPDSILPDVTWSAISEAKGTGSEAYIEKTITGTIDVSRYPAVRNKPVISAVLRTPQNATVGVPVIIFPGSFGYANDLYWERLYTEGWGTCIFNVNLLQPDNGAGLTSYLIGLVNKGNWRKPDDWGTLAAWSWGISRLIDYLEKDKNVNPKVIGVSGHSRYGKAALLAMALDQRIAIGFPSDAGSLGTKMNRRHWGQDLEHSTGINEYHWMAGNFFRWAGEKYPGQYLPRKIADCPVDAHSVLALCAPRPVLINGGTGSAWSDPYGMYLTARNATPVYRLLGTEGLIMNDPKPVPDKAYLEGNIGYRYHNGGHTDAPEWPSFFKFAAKYFDIPVLNISASSLVFDSYEGLETKIFVTSSGEAEIIPSDYWIKVRPDETSDSLIVSVVENKRQPSDNTYTVNSDYASRSGYFTVSAKGRKQVIHVYQASVKPTLELSAPDLFLAEKEDSKGSFWIYSNSAWTVTTDAEWLSFSDEAGINDMKIVVTAEANDRAQQRVATIRINSPGFKQAVLVSVVQKEASPLLNVSATSLPMDPGPGSAYLAITSNTPWEINVSDEWIRVNVRNGESSRQVIISTAENPSDTPRKGLVTIIANGVPSKVIEVVQEGRR